MTFIERRPGVWDEELMCDVEPHAPLQRSRRSLGSGLRLEVNARNIARAKGLDHELTRGGSPSVVYAPSDAAHGNFIDASYKRIVADAEWSKRLLKVHTAKRQARPVGAREEVRTWRELDAAASSDALLMNVFCYPRVLGRQMCALLGVSPGCKPEFGYKPRMPLVRGLVDTTEVDMRLDGLMVEAKLTEADFQTAPVHLMERFLGFDEVFERQALEVRSTGVRSYQLIRGALAAWASGERYCVLCDERRPDLIDAWFAVMGAVKSHEVRARLRLLTWQEIARVVPKALRIFLEEKYGIVVRERTLRVCR